MKIALLFAGQGAQFVGMGKDLYDNFPQAKAYFDNASDILGTPIKSICFEGPDETLKMTENTQPAIFLHSYICFKLLENEGIEGEAFAGFSLGEYSALTAAGIIKFEDALKLVRERGIIMDKAVTSVKGGMAAILGLEDEKVEELCKKVKSGVVVPVNYNCPGQLVVSGETEAVLEVCKLAEEAGAKKTVVLNVSGPFHSPLLEPGSAPLKNALEKYTFSAVSGKKIMSNVTAEYHKEGGIKPLLMKQMYSPVRWRKSVENLIADGFDTFIEAGPGKTLSGFMRSINREKTSLSTGNIDSLKKTIVAVKG